jgi:hypothetical protein
MITLNYLAIFSATVIAFIIGGVWYSPAVFGQTWARAQGYSAERLAAMEGAKPPARALVTTFVCQFVVALAFAVLKWWMDFDGWFEGLLLAILVWGGFVATVGLIGHVFSERSLLAYVIDTTCQLVYFSAIGIIIGEWR